MGQGHGVTKFFALSEEEFQRKYLPVKTHPKDIYHDDNTSDGSIFVDSSVPDSFDWRKSK